MTRGDMVRGEERDVTKGGASSMIEGGGDVEGRGEGHVQGARWQKSSISNIQNKIK